MSIFAPDEIKENRGHFSQESVGHDMQASFAKFCIGIFALIISNLQNQQEQKIPTSDK